MSTVVLKYSLTPLKKDGRGRRAMIKATDVSTPDNLRVSPDVSFKVKERGWQAQGGAPARLLHQH